jgi:HK97 gp10 family phage protein
MSVSLTSKIPQLAKDIENAVARSVALGAAELGRNIKEMLSKPGRGRIYVKRAAGRQAISKQAKRTLKRIGVKLRSSRQTISRQELAAGFRKARAAGVRIKRADRTAFWRASAPGDPPAVRTGELRRRWQTAFQSATPGKVGNKYRVSIGNNLPYAAYLEFGTRSMRERPYIRPAAAAFRPRMQQIVSEQLDRVLAKYRGKR